LIDLSRDWTELPLVVIDTETTGLPSYAVDSETGEATLLAEICEIAAVRFESGRAVGEYSTLVQTERPIPEDATKIHGITNAMVAGKPCIEEAAAGVWKVARNALPVAFNAPFDRQFFHARVQGDDCPAFDPGHAWLDVYTIVSSPRVDKWVKGSGRLKLGACCKRHGVELTAAHRALGDALATGKLLWRLHEKGLVKACSAQRVLQWAAVRREEQDADHARYRARMERQKQQQALF
jgi:DNA polymerase III epsilon subunit-like protein